MVEEIPEDKQLQRKAGDRRERTDRRRTIVPWSGLERRQGNRRQAIDRRGLPFGVHYKTSEPLAILYDWLRDHCYGKWSVGIEPAGSDPFKKAVKVLFEMESDKDTFMSNVVRG
jgi:hypothetical protein